MTCPKCGRGHGGWDMVDMVDMDMVDQCNVT